jgi:hypothetical protein
VKDELVMTAEMADRISLLGQSPNTHPVFAPADWKAINLALLSERSAVMPTIGRLGFVYPGLRHVFSGPFESAKTLIAYIVAIEEVRIGGFVVLIDLEMGEYEACDRLRALGATDEDLAGIHYLAPETPPGEERLTNLVGIKPTLVIIDAAAGAYELTQLDDSTRKDVERFNRIWINPFWKAGVATILIDHVVKATDSRGKYAIGSERKIASTDVHIGFEAIGRPLKRGRTATYKLTTHKDRPGFLARPVAGELILVSAGKTGGIEWSYTATQPSGRAGSFRPTALMEKVSRFLEYQSEPVSRNRVENNVEGKAKNVRDAIDILVADGHIAEEAGPHNSKQLSIVKPFRAPASDLVPTSSRPDDAVNTADEPDLVPNPRDEDKPRNHAVNDRPLTPRPDLVPTSSHNPDTVTSSRLPLPTGSRTGRSRLSISPFLAKESTARYATAPSSESMSEAAAERVLVRRETGAHPERGSAYERAA